MKRWLAPGLVVLFAVANREIVTVSLDPFDPAQPALAVRMPLFVLIFVFLILGVLLGGFIADLTRRHAEVAALGYAVNACIVLGIGTVGFDPLPLLLAMSCAGLLSGMIMPSRDMLVRAAAPAGAVGRTFGIVTSGFGIGGMVGPLMFGFAMDRGAPQWVFGISVILMIAVSLVALIGDRRSARRRAAPLQASASAD